MTEGEQRRVTVGSTVRIRNGSDIERAVHIRSKDGHASWSAASVHEDTPLARALLNRAVGDEVDVQAHPVLPVRRVTILHIDPPH